VLRSFFPKERKDIRPIKSHLFVIFQKFEILLLFASNKNLKKKKTSKKERRRILHRTYARARCFVAGVEKRVGGRDTIRVAAVWQRSRGGLFCFFEEEEKAKKFRE
jgi:hypothetical protein